MKITVLAVGKIKEKYFADAIREYSKRLGRYCKLEIIEVADEKTPDHASIRQQELIKEKEAARLKKYMRDGVYVAALAVEGKQYTSEQFSEKIHALGLRGESHIIFVIGGSIGLSQEILHSADERISFSKLTFPHQLMRVILLEQIYRGYRIMNGEPYHK
ncbi:MAG: 23S rRNA (pseudouridine(1915)-N(3))-methyltransferase RlmH [Clostridiaceae bacterium]|nr:23S rRNA (pseudouridine(1915)-N(3))-methyltransferase RlmH [Clostridiaceae bacterium]